MPNRGRASNAPPFRKMRERMGHPPFGEGYAGGDPRYTTFTTGGYTLTSNLGQNEGGTLDDFGFRRYSPSQGRWISPDPAGISAANLANPQSWNRYAYVLNNPLSNVDPSGLDCVYPPDYDGPADYETKGGFRVSLGDCHDSNDSGFYFDGTIDPNSIGMDQNGDIWASMGGGPEQCSGDCPTDSVTVSADQPADPCANSALSIAGVDPQQQISTAQRYIANGQASGSVVPYASPLTTFLGGMAGYYYAVHTNGPNDIKNLP